MRASFLARPERAKRVEGPRKRLNLLPFVALLRGCPAVLHQGADSEESQNQQGH